MNRCIEIWAIGGKYKETMLKEENGLFSSSYCYQMIW